jgi:transposase
MNNSFVGLVNQNSIVVGVDVHKYSHTAVALNCFGQEMGKFEFSNDNLDGYASWLNTLGSKENLIVALEDVNGYGVHLVKRLASDGFPIRYVPAILTERDRKQSTQHDKSDLLDARRVGKVILTKFEETLPARESIADRSEIDTAVSLDLLLSERRDIVKEKTALKNQLHALLHQYYGDHYKDDFPKAFHKKAIAFYTKDLARENSSNDKHLLGQSIQRRIQRLILVEEQIKVITKDLEKAGKKSKQVVTLTEQIHGCGMVTACAIVSEITTIRRFKNKAKLAKYAGVSPTERSSGAKNRLYTNPFGNRTLNRAIHTIALSQIAIRGDQRGKIYYQKKLSEGKTKLWAMRCLKRQLINRVFRTLKSVEN